MPLTRREAAIITAYTGYMIGDFAAFQEYAEELLGGPVGVATLSLEAVQAGLREKAHEDFLNIPVEDEP